MPSKSSFMFPMLVVTWVCVVIWMITLTAGIYRAYNESLEHRLEKQQPHIDAFNHNCRNAEQIIRMDFANQCHELRHKLREDPAVYAAYDVLETRGLCFGYNCEQMFQRLGFGSSPLQAMLLVCLVVWFLVGYLGIKMSNVGLDKYSKQYLPHTTTDPRFDASSTIPLSNLMANYTGYVAPPEYKKIQ